MLDTDAHRQANSFFASTCWIRNTARMPNLAVDRPDAPSPRAEPLIRLDDVRKRFRLPDGKTFDAVRPTSLQVERGDIFGLVGKSGAGKSTLLRLINLLERPDAGRVVVGGRELTALGKTELRHARQAIGMIFQQFNLLQNATVFDNVAFPLRIHGRHGKAQVAARVEECLALVGLAEKAASHPARLSGGQKQRVAIARALAMDPELLLFDEPTSALDPELVGSVLEVMRSLRESGMTMIVVSHEMGFARAAADRVVFMDHGLIVEQGAPAAIFENPTHERTRAFIGQIRRH